jgi:hypothetical protein
MESTYGFVFGIVSQSACGAYTREYTPHLRKRLNGNGFLVRCVSAEYTPGFTTRRSTNPQRNVQGSGKPMSVSAQSLSPSVCGPSLPSGRHYKPITCSVERHLHGTPPPPSGRHSHPKLCRQRWPAGRTNAVQGRSLLRLPASRPRRPRLARPGLLRGNQSENARRSG